MAGEEGRHLWPGGDEDRRLDLPSEGLVPLRGSAEEHLLALQSARCEGLQQREHRRLPDELIADIAYVFCRRILLLGVVAVDLAVHIGVGARLEQTAEIRISIVGAAKRWRCLGRSSGAADEGVGVDGDLPSAEREGGHTLLKGHVSVAVRARAAVRSWCLVGGGGGAGGGSGGVSGVGGSGGRGTAAEEAGDNVADNANSYGGRENGCCEVVSAAVCVRSGEIAASRSHVSTFNPSLFFFFFFPLLILLKRTSSRVFLRTVSFVSAQVTLQFVVVCE